MRRSALGPGFRDGPDMRAERHGSGWAIQIRLRDVGSPIDSPTGVYEYDAGGFWTPIGTYGTLDRAEAVLCALKAGSHLFVGPYSSGGIPLPGRIVPFAEARARLAEIGFCEDVPGP